MAPTETNGHHKSRLNPLGATIRTETAADHAGIRDVLVEAFATRAEAQLVEALRASEFYLPELSLVAEHEGRIVGHVLFSRLPVRVKVLYVQALALAPLAVHPEFQQRGVGTALVEHGMAIARRKNFPFVVVVGDPRYYVRFGFKLARPALEANLDFPFEVFQAAELRPGSLSGLQGRVEYPAVFEGA
jgi:putative acetyltransferase